MHCKTFKHDGAPYMVATIISFAHRRFHVQAEQDVCTNVDIIYMYIMDVWGIFLHSHTLLLGICLNMFVLLIRHDRRIDLFRGIFLIQFIVIETIFMMHHFYKEFNTSVCVCVYFYFVL